MAANGKSRLIWVALLQFILVGSSAYTGHDQDLSNEFDHGCDGRDVLECLSERAMSFQFPLPSVLPSNPSLPPVNPSLPPPNPSFPNPFPPPNPSFPNPFPPPNPSVPAPFPPNPSFPNPFPPPNPSVPAPFPPNPSFPNPFPPSNPSVPVPFPPPNPSVPNPFPPNPSFPPSPSFPPNPLPSAGVPVPSVPIVFPQKADDKVGDEVFTDTEVSEAANNGSASTPGNSTSSNSKIKESSVPENVQTVASRSRRESSPRKVEKTTPEKKSSIKRIPWWSKRSVGQRARHQRLKRSLLKMLQDMVENKS